MPQSRWGKLNSLPRRLSLQHESMLGYLLVGPVVLYLLFFLGYPLLYALYLSFTDKQIGTSGTFVGLDNFVTLGQTRLFWKSAANSVIYTAAALVLKLVLGLALAGLLDRPFYGRRLIQAAILLPWIVPTVFSTLSWLWILDPAFSIVNIVLKQVGLTNNSLPFLVHPTWAMGSLVLVNVWRGVPFFAITSLAALQTVPEDLLEASQMDGANRWQRFIYVIWPHILPVVLIVVLISMIGTISEFELPFLLTRGGPNDATTVFGILAYNLLLGTGQVGRGAAVSLTMFPVLALLVVLVLRQVRRQG